MFYIRLIRETDKDCATYDTIAQAVQRGRRLVEHLDTVVGFTVHSCADGAQVRAPESTHPKPRFADHTGRRV